MMRWKLWLERIGATVCLYMQQGLAFVTLYYSGLQGNTTRKQGGKSTCHSLHWPNPALLDRNFSQVLVHFLVKKIFHFQHDVGNALRQVIATCFSVFQAVSATMLPVKWRGCAGNIGAYLGCSYPISLEKHYPELSHSKSDISYLTT
ncbi:hypothetical protein Y032_0123g1158 [Ancylostoma ceylanicum]|uniref:Uncharacterized protein n=1 Tax=Ancylostoma ceylanicum TaxID=53326 RepID=A0A016T9Q6_9BILA|nr:hypothetical protein Y032_0123g1158 [Ancylostoma ceylanicum]